MGAMKNDDYEDDYDAEDDVEEGSLSVPFQGIKLFLTGEPAFQRLVINMRTWLYFENNTQAHRDSS
jgi:hypothetical protein